MRRSRHLIELIIVVAFVAIAVAVYRNSQPPPADDLSELGEGLRLYKARQYKEAIPYFTEVLRRQPQVLQARLYRALSYEALGDRKAAREDFETGKQSEPPLVQYLYPKLSLSLYRQSSLLYSAEGDFEKALEDAEKAMKRSEIKQFVHSGGWPFSPDWAATHHVRGMAYAGLERYEEARSDLQMAGWMDDEPGQKLANRHLAAIELLKSSHDITAAEHNYDQSQGAKDDGCFLCQKLRPFEGPEGQLHMPGQPNLMPGPK